QSRGARAGGDLYARNEIDPIKATHHLLLAAKAADRAHTKSEARSASLAARIQSSALLATFVHDAEVKIADFTLGGSTIVTLISDGIGRLWKATDGKLIGEPMTHGAAVRGARFSTDSQRVLVWGYDNIARLWNATDGKSVGRSMKHEKQGF